MEEADRGAVNYVALFEALPELLDGVAVERRERLRKSVYLQGERFGSGYWRPSSGEATLGFLVLSGVISRTTGRLARQSIEFLGAGDPVLSIPDASDVETQWKVLSRDVLVVYISPEVMNRLILVPGVMRRLWQRSELLHQRATVNFLTASITRVPASLYVALWDLANRFGQLTEVGVTLPFELDGRALAALAATNRTTASRALSRLRRAGLVGRTASRQLVLAGSEPKDEADLILVLASLGEVGLAEAS